MIDIINYLKMKVTWNLIFIFSILSLFFFELIFVLKIVAESTWARGFFQFCIHFIEISFARPYWDVHYCQLHSTEHLVFRCH